MNVLLEVLTEKFEGIIVCDGWRSYPSLRNTCSNAGRIFFENQRISLRRSRKLFSFA